MNLHEIINSAKKLSINEIQVLVGSILRDINYDSIFCKNQTFTGLYRARQHKQIDGQNEDYIFTNEKEFWNPSKEFIKKLGRCNDIGESMFYSSNHFETSILEVRPVKDEFITVAHFLPIVRDKKVPSFRIKPNCIQHLKKIKDFKSCIEEFNISKRGKNFLEVDNLLDELFTDIVDSENEYKYKVSIAITRCMLTKIVNDFGDEFSMNGMIYPSIVNKMNSINILLKPIYAINFFHIASLQTLKVLKVTNNEVIVKLVRNGHTIGLKDHPSKLLDIHWFSEINGEIHHIKY